MTKLHVGIVAALAITVMTAGCGGSSDGNASPTDGPAATTGPNGTSNPDQTQPVDTNIPQSTPQATDPETIETAETTDTTPVETVPIVTVDVTGTAVAGNSGGVGKDQTQPVSETIRNDDGSCSGWEGPGDAGQWTQGLEVGAPVQILDPDTDEQIGDGSVTASSWADVDPTDNEQWNCTFVFEGTASRSADSFKIKIADLQPWVARPDSTNPGQFVASVDTQIELSRVSSCTDHEPGEEIFEWRAVGDFWLDGLQSVCSNGLVVDQIKRPCRPPSVASEYVIAVRSAADPNVVFEDASGLLVDVATLAPDTKVIVDVATGRPC
jgi:hypothetical protein